MLHLHHLPGSNLHEEHIHVLRRHPITLLPAAALTFILFLIPIAGFFLAEFLRPGFFASPEFLTLSVIGISLFFLFGWLFVFQYFIEYWLDIFIVTNKRVLDIDQSGLFGRTVSELRLYRLQDVTSEVKGFWHMMLDYGNLYVQTAGEKQRFEVKDIAHPNQLAKLILAYMEKDQRFHQTETETKIHETISKEKT